MLKSSLFWNQVSIPDASKECLDPSEGRGGHLMIKRSNKVIALGGEENLATNWLQQKEESKAN